MSKAITMKNGRTGRFNQKLFHDAVDRKSKPPRNKNDVYRGIAKLIYPNMDDEKIEEQKGTIKNWYSGRNGPNLNCNELQKIEEYLDLKDGALLIPDEKEKGDEKRMINAISTIQPAYSAFSRRDLVNAMREGRIEEEAYKLYGILTDLISEYIKVDEYVWFECDEGTEEFAEGLKLYPKRYPVEIALRKSAVFLPSELRSEVENLLEEMYGGQCFCWDEADSHPLFSPAFTGFTANKKKHIKEYVETYYSDCEDEDEKRFSYVTDMQYEWFYKLDCIFEDYIRD